MQTAYDDAPLGAEAYPLFAPGSAPDPDPDEWSVGDEIEELREIGRMLGFDC